MFGKFSEQLKKTAEPVNSLVALNAKTLEDLSQHQTELFTGLLSDSVKYMESVTHQSEIKGVFAANSAFAEAMRDRFASVSKETYSTLSVMREQVSEVMKQSLESTASEVETAVEKSVKTVEKTVEKVTKLATEVPAPAEVKKVEEVKAKPTTPAKAEAKPAAKAPAKKPATRTRKTTTAAKKPAATKAATPKASDDTNS